MGQPNGYVLGEEGAAPLWAGFAMVTELSTRRTLAMSVAFWQGPTMGFDIGADGARTMMLVYNLPRTEAILKGSVALKAPLFLSVDFGMTALGANDIVVVPIRAGVGLRLGANLGYLKFTPRPTWNPF